MESGAERLQVTSNPDRMPFSLEHCCQIKRAAAKNYRRTGQNNYFINVIIFITLKLKCSTTTVVDHQRICLRLCLRLVVTDTRICLR